MTRNLATTNRTKSKKRLFFALWPEQQVRESIAKVAEQHLDAASRKTVPADNYHITLAFLGAVSAGSLADIVRVAESVRFLPFMLELNRLGRWQRSQVQWLAPQSQPLPLTDLVDNLWNKLAAMGFHYDGRPYRPHVTLSRGRQDGGFSGPVSPIVWHVSSFVLVESGPGTTHPVYTVLEQFHAGA